MGPDPWRARALVGKLERACPVLAGAAGQRGSRTEVFAWLCGFAAAHPAPDAVLATRCACKCAVAARARSNTDVRLDAAFKRHRAHEVQHDHYRQGLCCRLNVVPIRLPSLPSLPLASGLLALPLAHTATPPPQHPSWQCLRLPKRPVAQR